MQAWRNLQRIHLTFPGLNLEVNSYSAYVPMSMDMRVNTVQGHLCVRDLSDL